MDKSFITKHYKLAYLEYKIAATEEQKWYARVQMANWLRTAMELYGFEFADSLHLSALK